MASNSYGIQGESEQLAAIREAKEECGIDIDTKNIQLAYAETAYYEKENKSVSKLFYIAHVDNVPEVTLSWEHSDYKWVSVRELHTIELRPFFKEAIEYSVTSGRASDAAHRSKDKTEAYRILRYFDAFAFDLLNLKAS